MMASHSIFSLYMRWLFCRTPVTVGRGIRRLVSLYESVDDIVQAADQQQDDSNDDDEAEEDDSLAEDAAERKRE